MVVDCLNLWVANMLHKRPELSDADLLTEATHLAAVAARPRFSLVLVSNEVGWGVHPATELGRRFRDALGLVNQAVARAADEVVLMVAGCPLVVKGGDAHGPAEEAGFRDRARASHRRPSSCPTSGWPRRPVTGSTA